MWRQVCVGESSLQMIVKCALISAGSAMLPAPPHRFMLKFRRQRGRPFPNCNANNSTCFDSIAAASAR